MGKQMGLTDIQENQVVEYIGSLEVLLDQLEGYKAHVQFCILWEETLI